MMFSICTAQRNFVVGDLPGNAQKIIDAARAAHAAGARLLLTPELALCGYAAEDLLLRPAFLCACDETVKSVACATAELVGLTIVLGHPQRRADGCYNAASVLRNGLVECSYAKQALPNYQVFDEQRYFTAGQSPCVFEVEGVRIGLLICEDAWHSAAAQQSAEAGAQLLAVLNASPFHQGKPAEREAMLRERVQETGLPLVYAHLVGGQDELIFDGHSFALGADGAVCARAAGFEESLMYVQLSSQETGHCARSEAKSQNLCAVVDPATSRRMTTVSSRAPGPLAGLDGSGGVSLHAEVRPLASAQEQLWRALVLGVRDYVGKNGFPGVLLGLSGGIDSALVLAIAVDALGAAKVRTVMMPSPYTADISWIDARDMAERLGVAYKEIAIAPQFDAFKAALADDFAGLAEDTTEENLQARIRGTLLMALSNKFGALVLTTGNKSEMATGYCTLYGDMAGGFAVIKDLLKTQVFALANWRNAHDPFGTGVNPIPERIITRPPSAELRPDQKDQDSLPPYAQLDAIIERYMENDESVQGIVAAGFAAADVDRVTRLIQINEYKRRQAPIGVRLTRRSFGKDWRYPITNKFRA